MIHIRKFFAPPVFPSDKDKKRIRQYLNTIILSTIGLLSILYIYRLATHHTVSNPTDIFLLATIVILVILRFILHYGYVLAVSIAFTAFTWLAMTYQAYSNDGVRDVTITAYIVIILTASLLMGWRYSLPFFGLSIVAMWVMANAQATGARAFTLDSPLNTARNLTIIFVLVLVTTYLIISSLNEALTLTRQRLEERKRAEEDLARQVERLRALHTIEQAITSSTDLKTVLKLLARTVIEQLRMDALSILLLNEDSQTLDLAAREGFRTDALKYTRLKIGAGLAGQAAEKREVVHIPDLAQIQNDSTLYESICGEDFAGYFGIPLIATGHLRGVMEVFHRSAFASSPDWLSFLETLAGQAAVAIDNARMLEMTQTHLKETEALYHINQELAASIDPLWLMKDVVALLQESFGYFYVQIFVREPETGDFVLRAGSGPIGKKLVSQGYRFPAGEGILGYTAETGEPFFTNDVDKVIAFRRSQLLPDTKSELAVPIKVGQQFLGLLDIHQAPPAYLTGRDVQLVSAVADQLAVALQKAQLYSDLQTSLLQEQATRSRLIQSEKLAIAGRLLASVSHELNNPLQAIQNTLYLLKEEEKRISVQGLQDLKIVLAETERMATLLDRLRTSYQPARAEDFRPVQINNIIEDVRALVATHLRHARISFESHPDPALPSIPGLGDQLKQVMFNLFMNAVDAMAGGGRLNVSTRWLAENREILITVADTGAGIDESVLPYMFEAFVTNKEKGTGLGLAISYEIVLKHRGRIQAENVPAGGATFSIWLPVENGGTQ